MSEAVWSKLWVRVLVIALFVFALYSNVGLIIQNYQIGQKVSSAQIEVDQMAQRNQQLSLLLSYYQSPSYQDVEARRRLGMKQPDETVYAVKGVTFPDLAPSDQLELSINQAAGSTANADSNISKWLKYFSGNK